MKVVILIISGEKEVALQYVRAYYPDSKIDILFKEDFFHMSPLNVMKNIFKFKSDVFLMFCNDISFQRRMIFLKMILLLCRAKYKLIVDSRGGEIRTSFADIIFRELPLFCFSLVYAAFVVASSYLLLVPVYIHLSSKKRKKSHYPDKIGVGLKAAYLWTNFWFNLKAGGSLSHTLGFSKGFIRSGGKLFFLSSVELEHISAANIPVHMFPPSNRFNALPIEISELTYNVKFTYNALQLLKMEKPDFLYQRSSTLNYSGMALSVILGIPLFLEFNSSAVWDKGGHGKVPFYLMKLLVEKINLLSAEKIFVVSAVLKKKLTSAGIPEDKIIINPNGVDPSVFNPKVDNGIVRAEYNLNEKNIIGFIGVFGQWHGVDTLVKAIPHVIDANRNVHFLIIGDGYLRKRLDEIVEQNNVGAFITFTGVIPYSSVPKYLNACDILASPHRNMADGANFFGSPVKIFEYMAMEKPIVASNLHQLGEVLKDGETALLATPDDEESLADAILRLISDHALRTRLGINARKEVIKNYTWQRNAERVIEAYWQLGNKSKN